MIWLINWATTRSRHWTIAMIAVSAYVFSLATRSFVSFGICFGALVIGCLLAHSKGYVEGLEHGSTDAMKHLMEHERMLAMSRSEQMIRVAKWN